MAHYGPTQTSAADIFRQARRQAAMEQIMARLTGRSTALLSFSEVCDKLRLENSSERGRQEIPLAAIVGSVGRYSDFSRSFLPLKDSDEGRWSKVNAVMTRMQSLPPIEVYQIGQAYFVVDGNHRVSVARRMGLTYIEAFVTECQTKVALGLDDRPDDLIVKAEYADFLETTRLDKIRPEANLSVTVPGQYWELETHIEAHRYLLGQEEEREILYEEAVAHWYDYVYLPVAQSIRQQGILRDFPGRTETDLYLWLFRHRADLEKKLGWQIELEAVVADLVSQHSPRPQRRMARVEQKLRQTIVPPQLEAGPAPGQWRQERVQVRSGERLFADILVPVDGGQGGWHALDLALAVAQREGSHLMGLHVVSSTAQQDSQIVQGLKAEFEQRCEAAGVAGELSLEVGKVVGTICDRARWTDLIVMHPANPPGLKVMSRLSSGSRNVIFGSCRPVLTVPAAAAAPERILLAYDGSPKAREGLYVAAYLAEQWGVWLVVMTVVESEADTDRLAQAHQYLQARGVTATLVPAQGNVAGAILSTADHQDSDLIIIGGYGVRPVREAVLGSKVDRVLRDSQRPLFVCR